MQEYQQRVVDEASALSEKIEKLGTFISNPNFNTLEELDQRHLILQLSAMTTYYAILNLRIDRFKQ